MKQFILLSMALVVSMFFVSCEGDGVVEPTEKEGILPAIQVLEFDATDTVNTNYFSFRENKRIDAADANTDKWDVAFATKYIYTNSGYRGPGNGGAIILTGTNFTDVEEAPESGWMTDDSETDLAIPTGSGKGWYNYDFMNHIMSPIPGNIIVIRCADGKYAKMQILSYYKGYPENIPADPVDMEERYYSFKYSIQMDGSRDLR